MRRLFSADIAEDRVTLDEEQARHARKVLRLKPGESVELFDGRGRIAEGKLDVQAGKAAVQVARRWEEKPPRPRLELAVAMPKGSRADVLVEKVSELGVDRLIPMHTARSVVAVGETKVDRLRRLAVASAKQSGRAHLMEVAEVSDFSDVLAEAGEAAVATGDGKVSGGASAGRRLLLITDADGVGTIGPGDLLESLGKVTRVRVLVGPEGGWTVGEREAADEAGFVPWRMGPFTLRVETAAMAAAALCRQLV